jgi:hypothetical protein
VAQKKERSTSVAVGSYVDAVCGKCRDTTSHIVLAKIGRKPTRVECRTCHASHLFRDPAGTAIRAGSKATKKPAAAQAKPEEAWAKAMRSATGPGVPYSTAQHFQVGQRVRHPTFGEGVVTRLASATVCEMVFAAGPRRLLMEADANALPPRATRAGSRGAG